MEQAVIGYGNIDYVSDANLTISITNSNASQASRCLVLNVTSVFGALTATRELIVPTSQKQYIVQNNTTGGQSITVKTSAGTGITVTNGRKAHLYVDGTNVIQMFDFVDINGGAIDGTPVGASSASTGAFTTLASNAATTFTAGTASTTTGTGTLVITGGLGVSGRVNAANFDGIVGANTAAAGSFTTVGATGLVTQGTASGQNGVFGIVTGAGGANSGVAVVTGATGTGYLGFNNANNASIPGQVTYNHSTNTLNLYSTGPITFQPSGGTVSTLSSTGLAVTGALSTTGNITNSNAAGRLDFTGGSSAQVWATASSLYLDASAGQSVIIRPNNQVTAGTFSSTGLAVTGTGSYTGLLYLGGSAGTVAERLQVNRGTDDANQSSFLGYTSLTLERAGVAVASAGTFSFQVRGTTTVTPLTFNYAGVAVTGTFSSTSGASIQGLTVGLGNGAVGNNTALGLNALSGSNSGAGQNVAVGLSAMLTNSSGARNTVVGSQAGYKNTSGIDNVGIGNTALYNNETGAYNTAVGSGALLNNTASSNTAVGYQAGYSNVTGSGITAIGAGALYTSDVSGQSNTAVGLNCMYYSTTGYNNTATGHDALVYNTSGSNNTAFGRAALFSNTIASSNTAVGYQAGYSAVQDSNSTYLGYQAGYLANFGTASLQTNTFVGYQSGYSMTTGYYNTILGSFSGNQGGLDIRTATNHIVLSDGQGNPRGIFDSSGNLLVGTTSTLISTGRRLQVEGAVAAVFKGTGSGSECLNVWQTFTTGNNVFIEFDTEASPTGRGTITYNRPAGLVAYNTTSDYRAKTVNGSVQNALIKVALLKPSTGRMNGAEQDIDFFVAHELQEVVPSAVTGEKDAIKENGSPNYQMVDKSALIPLLTAAIQEQQALITQLTARITALEGA
jgi:hypothetical protein